MNILGPNLLMALQTHSAETIILIRDNLRDLGQKLVWTSVTQDDVEQVHVIIRALIEDDMFSLVEIDGKVGNLTNISVYQKNNGKIIDLSFAQSFVACDREHK